MTRADARSKSQPSPPDAGSVQARIEEALRTCYDPEIPVDIVELGLVYGVGIDEDNNVVVQMTLTAPGCPVADSLPEEVRAKVAAVRGVRSARVELVWSPPWDRGRMSEAALVALGFL